MKVVLVGKESTHVQDRGFNLSCRCEDIFDGQSVSRYENVL